MRGGGRSEVCGEGSERGLCGGLERSLRGEDRSEVSGCKPGAAAGLYVFSLLFLA